MKKDLLALPAVLLTAAATALTFLGALYLLTDFNAPNWLRSVLTLPIVAFSVFVGTVMWNFFEEKLSLL
jgi:ABC-type sugar transport system permease subunit